MNINNKTLIQKLYQNFDSLQCKLNKKPILGASKWHLVDYKILNNHGLIELSMEDGHVEHNVIVKYSKKKDIFEIEKEN